MIHVVPSRERQDGGTCDGDLPSDGMIRDATEVSDDDLSIPGSSRLIRFDNDMHCIAFGVTSDQRRNRWRKRPVMTSD